MNRKNMVLLMGLLLFVGLIAGGTFAYWTWNSTENKSVVFNTVGNVSDYIVYDEGLSYFVGDFKPTDSYCESVNTTVSFYKTEDAENIALRATINMDVNAIGTNIANSSDVYWVVTKGDSNIDCSGGLSGDIVLGSGTFYGKTVGETIKLASDIEVTTTLEKYTVWIWINSDGTDLSKLSGETVDTNVWTQIDMVDPDADNDAENDDDIYTITYNVNGGINGPVNQEKTAGESVTISSTVPTRTGYTFSGWNTIANGSGTSYSADATYTTDADLILYAVWTPNTYTISYNSGGGSGSTSATTCSYGKSCTLRNNGFTKTGYTFIGWSDSESGTEVVYEDGYTILLYNQTSNMTLYALWEINTYTISYNANYGTGEPTDQIKTYGETLTLSSAVPTRENHVFVEWNTAADGSGTSYQPGNDYNTEAGSTLYAIWRFEINATCPTISDVSATYDGNSYSITVTGGSGGTIKYSTDNTNWSTTIPTLVDAGTLITYVMVEGDSSHNSVTCDSGTVTIEQSPTATTGSCATLTYTGSAQTLASGGSYVSYSNNSRTDAGSQTVTVTSDDNHTFSDGTESKTLSCSIAQGTNTISVTAKGGTYTGTALSLVTTSNAQGTVYYSTSTALTSSNYSTSGSATIPTGAPGSSENSKTFTVYWYTSGNTNYKAASGTVSNITVSRKTYTVSYNECSGSGVPSDQTKYYGLTLTLSSAVPTRSHYTFAGWATDSCSGSVVYGIPGNSDSYNYTTNADATLYAIWKVNKAYVQFDTNGGSIVASNTSNNVTYTWTTDSNGIISRSADGGTASNKFFYKSYGSSGDLPNPDGTYMTITRTGYIPTSGSEWTCLSDNCVKTTYDDTTAYAATDYCDTSSGDCTIILGVNWSPKTINVTFHRNSSSSDTATASQTFTYGNSGNKFGYNTDGTAKWGTSGQFGQWDRTGYQLLGWALTSDATEKKYNIYSAVTDAWIEANYPSIDLYAVWVENTPVYAVVDGQAYTTGNSTPSYDTSAKYAGNGNSSGTNYYYTYYLKFTTPAFSYTSSSITINLNMRANNSSYTNISLRYALLSSDANYASYQKTKNAVTDANQIYTSTYTNSNLSASYTNVPFTISTTEISPNKTYYFVLWTTHNNGGNVVLVNSTDNHTVVIS